MSGLEGAALSCDSWIHSQQKILDAPWLDTNSRVILDCRFDRRSSSGNPCADWVMIVSYKPSCVRFVADSDRPTDPLARMSMCGVQRVWPTHIRPRLHAIQDGTSQGVLTHLCYDIAGALRRHYSGKDAFYLVPTLFDCVDVAFGRAAFETRT